MKLIDISTKKSPNTFAMVDDADYDWLNQWKWLKTSCGYAGRGETKGGKWRYISMHREILGAGSGLDVDHINGAKLDNRRSNLRICTRSQNLMNQNKQNGKTIAKGVYLHPSGKFKSTIKVNARSMHLGYFESEESAKTAYNEAAIKYFGEFARINP